MITKTAPLPPPSRRFAIIRVRTKTERWVQVLRITVKRLLIVFNGLLYMSSTVDSLSQVSSAAPEPLSLATFELNGLMSTRHEDKGTSPQVRYQHAVRSGRLVHLCRISSCATCRLGGRQRTWLDSEGGLRNRWRLTANSVFVDRPRLVCPGDRPRCAVSFVCRPSSDCQRQANISLSIHNNFAVVESQCSKSVTVVTELSGIWTQRRSRS